MQDIAPFGADIAVLAYNTALEGSSPRPLNNLAKAAAAMPGGDGPGAAGVSTELQHERPELKILPWNYTVAEIQLKSQRATIA